jgi:hypothetical protein
MCGKIHSPALLITLPLFLSLCTAAQAASYDETPPNAQAISQLELRAQQAGPRDQCFLYAELIHSMTEIAGRQLLQGDVDQAGASLKKVEQYASLMSLSITNNAKRIKDAEQLMHHTTYRLGEYLRQASWEDRPTLQTALKQIDQVHDELLTQVFKH